MKFPEGPPPIFPAGFVIDARPRTFEELEANAERWNLTTCQLERGTYRAVLQAVHTPRLQLARTWRALRSFIEGRIPQGSILVALPAGARTELCFRGRLVGESEAVLLHHSDPFAAGIGGTSEIVTLAVSEAELERRANILWHRPFPRAGRHGTIRFSKNVPAGTGFLQTLEGALSRAGAFADERPARDFEDLLLDQLLALIETPGDLPDKPGRHRIARRAEEYLRAHCGDAVSITDLCAATGAARRTVHLGFCELYGMPPMTYLKALRLSRVRRDLLSAPRSRAGVTEAAMRWGFSHLGRFAAEYRDFFGELPSVERARTESGSVAGRRFR
ncbi:MAG TPA: helix-turn-helix domain-containing protein [Terrimicrobiaceae bacterium]|nr:helix-turn-helix domain-containing protein [Terrimicrobiaceae bacterium]